MNKQRYNNNLNLLLVLCLNLTLFACATTKNSDTHESEDEIIQNNLNVKFRTLSQGAYSNISLANQFVIRNQKEWQRSWDIHNGRNSNNRPDVNFENDFVIAVFAGQQPSGGYKVGISNITRKDQDLFVTLTFTEPGRNEKVSLALTQPYIFIATRKVEGKIIFLAGK